MALKICWVNEKLWVADRLGGVGIFTSSTSPGEVCLGSEAQDLWAHGRYLVSAILVWKKENLDNNSKQKTDNIKQDCSSDTKNSTCVTSDHGPRESGG